VELATLDAAAAGGGAVDADAAGAAVAAVLLQETNERYAFNIFKAATRNLF